MSRRASFTQAEIERVMRASKKLGVPAEIDAAAGVIRVLTPEPQAVQMTDLQKWRAAKNAKRTA